MKRGVLISAVLFLVVFAKDSVGDEQSGSVRKPATTNKVYGEWLIRVKPDKGVEYNQLIEQQGLPLFREAGGRMVGWWNTLVGDLYEHVTIWEYDNMATFERAVALLDRNESFAEFAKQRDPLLSGEKSRFLKLADGAEQPRLPETHAAVIHEFHHVPFVHLDGYLTFMQQEGLSTLKKHGFRPVGPFVAEVGKWGDVTYLFRFESLAERERLRAAFQAHADSKAYGAKLSTFVEDVTTRVLISAPFARPQQNKSSRKPMSSLLLPHLTELVPGVYATGFADRHGSANCGWVALSDQTLLIDLPRGVEVAEFLQEVQRTAGKVASTLVLTHLQDGDAKIVASLIQQGIKHIVTSSPIRTALVAGEVVAAEQIHEISSKTTIGEPSVPIDVVPFDGVAGQGGLVVHMPKQDVLFAGPFAVNGPWTRLAGSDTGRWVTTLRQLERLTQGRRYTPRDEPRHMESNGYVVPGFGSWGRRDILVRQRRYLEELRRQVGYVIAQGRPQEVLGDEVRMPAENLVWAPYDRPKPEDMQHVYREMTVPVAPFSGRHPQKSDEQAHALVLYADQPHEPGYILDGLGIVFEDTGVTAHFTVDVEALSAENLSKVQLLVILRDGLQRPGTGKGNYVWMTDGQQKAIVEFVQSGGAFLNLHNAMGLYPDKGGYLDLVGGRYIGHGPLERFRVEVVDPDHPITRGVRGFSVADEQHTPPYDSNKVHLLLRNRSDDGKVAAAGWAYESGEGRICHLANGHTRESLLHPMYQRLLRNAVNWCLRRAPVP
jgi:type 1 glutamine amidotransferase